MANFAERLNRLRREHNITLKEMAEELELTQATLSRYENEMRIPKLDILCKIANYLGVSLDYLAGKSEEKKTAETIKAELLSSENERKLKLWKVLKNREDLQHLIDLSKDIETRELDKIIRIIKILKEGR